MGIILAGLIVDVGIFILALIFDFLTGGIRDIIFGIILLAVLFGMMGIIVPTEFSEPELYSTIDLVSLSDETVSSGRGMIYVSISGANSYTYYVEVESPYGDSTSKSYKSNTISGNNITVVESDEFMDAKLAVYKSIPKKDFWSFRCFERPKYEYVFYVPKGTIDMNFHLGE